LARLPSMTPPGLSQPRARPAGDGQARQRVSREKRSAMSVFEVSACAPSGETNHLIAASLRWSNSHGGCAASISRRPWGIALSCPGLGKIRFPLRYPLSRVDFSEHFSEYKNCRLPAAPPHRSPPCIMKISRISSLGDAVVSAPLMWHLRNSFGPVEDLDHGEVEHAAVLRGSSSRPTAAPSRYSGYCHSLKALLNCRRFFWLWRHSFAQHWLSISSPLSGFSCPAFLEPSTWCYGGQKKEDKESKRTLEIGSVGASRLVLLARISGVGLAAGQPVASLPPL